MRTRQPSGNEAIACTRPPFGRGDACAEARRDELLAWANHAIGGEPTWAAVAADASVRRYFRGRSARHSWIAVDAPPGQVANDAFVRVATLLADAGLNAPTVYAYDSARGFMLVSDLGGVRYIDGVGPANAEACFNAAIDALIAWQRTSRVGVLPAYDRATLRAEMALFRDWYIGVHLGQRPGTADHRDLDAAFDRVLDRICGQPSVFVHRDYMPRNLLIAEPMPGVIDFQDARYGPVTYDIVSLCQDAFISWPPAQVRAWHRRYWQRARAAGVPVAAEWSAFCRDAELMGVQRHLKILGLFARLTYRDDKPAYLVDTPRIVGYLQPVLAADAKLAPLLRYLQPATQ